LLLDERNGVAYPDGQQVSDGLIGIIYDYSRTGDLTILMASFREEDVVAGEPMTASVRLRQTGSQSFRQTGEGARGRRVIFWCE
jgi:hypothetical protein